MKVRNPEVEKNKRMLHQLKVVTKALHEVNTNLNKMLKNYNLVTQAGAWYTYTNTDTGEIVKFQSKDFKSKLIDDPEMKEQVYKTICEKYILNYKAGDDFGIDDIKVETEFDGEES